MLSLLRNATIEQLRDVDWLAAAIAELGIEEPTRRPARGYPVEAIGRGLRIWQTPIQFAPYLIALSEVGVRSYVELGVHTGGSMIATVEYLARFGNVAEVLAVDMELQPSVCAYAASQACDELTLLDARTDSPDVEAWLDEHRPDLVFIDADHSERGCRRDWEVACRYARFVAFHDVVEWSCPGVGQVWRSITGDKRAWTDQYDDGPQLHGIGLVGPLR
jgi:cephalosporin hydroxylase